MTVRAEVETEIRRLHYAEHWPVGTIARQLGVHEDVVRRGLGLLTPRRSQAPRKRLVDDYVDVIERTLKQYPKLRATRLYDMLKARGYQGSVRTLREYVREVRPTPRHEAFVRLQPLVGEESQVDWARVATMPVAGGQRTLWLFVLVLSYSRGMWGELVYDLSAPSVNRSLVRAADYFGGNTRTWLFDNPKTVVVERSGDAVRFHSMLQALSGHYCVQLKLCAPRKANQKGRVERTIRYLRDRFFAARTIASIEHGNKELLDFIENIANQREHPTLPDTTVQQALDDEKPRLLRIAEGRPETDLVLSVTADKTAFVRFDTNSYSVPGRHTRKKLTLAACDQRVRILDGSDVVAEHERCWGRRQLVEDLAHRKEILSAKKAAADGKGRERLAVVVPDIHVLYQRWLDQGRNLGNLTLRTLQLLDRYGETVFKAAVDEVIACGAHDPGAIAVRCEHIRSKDNRPLPLDVPLGDHVPDRDVVPHDLGTYDATTRRKRRD